MQSKGITLASLSRVLGFAALLVLPSGTLRSEGTDWNPQPRVEEGLEQRASLLGIPTSRLAKAREALVQATRVQLPDLLENEMYDPQALLREWERLHPQAINSVISLRGAQLTDTRDSETVAKELVPLFAEMVETDPIRLRQLLTGSILQSRRTRRPAQSDHPAQVEDAGGGRVLQTLTRSSICWTKFNGSTPNSG